MDPWRPSVALAIYTDPWKIKTFLTDSDTSTKYRQLHLSKEKVESWMLPVLDGKNDLVFYDVDTDTEVPLKLRKFSNGCYAIGGLWNQGFIKRRNLNTGDEIGLQWDPYNHRFNFSILARA